MLSTRSGRAGAQGLPLVQPRNAILGHVDVKTTHTYARANLEMKRMALIVNLLTFYESP